jgi:hypothetical protein
VYARFAQEPPALDLPGARIVRRRGRELDVVLENGAGDADVLNRIKACSPEVLTSEALSLEEIFVATLAPEEHGA